MKNKKLNNLWALAMAAVCFSGAASSSASPLGPSVQLAPAAGAVAIASSKKPQSYAGFGAESIPAAIIKEFAPPMLDPESTKRIEKLLDLRGQNRGILNSKGSELFFNWRVTGVQQVWKMSQSQGFPIQLTGGEDRTSIAAVSPKDDFILISRDRKGEEFPGLYEMNPSGGELILIQHLAKIQTFFQAVSSDGQKVLFRSNHLDPKSYVISEYDRKTRAITEVFKTPGNWAVRDVSSNGDEWILALLTGSLSREIFKYTRSTQALVPLMGQGEKEEYDVRFGKKAGEYLVHTNKFGDFLHLYLWTPSEKNPWKDLTPDLVGEVSDFQISRDRKRIVFSTVMNAQSRAHTMIYGSFKQKSLKVPEDLLQFRGGTLNETGDYQVASLEKADLPPEIAVVDWDDLKFKEWTRASLPETERALGVRPLAEQIPTRDGKSIPAFVWTPISCAKKACPVILEFHGGPEGASAPGFNIDAHLFNNAGFVFVLPNVRGSAGYGKAFLKADDGPDRLKVVSDIEDAAIHFRKKFPEEKIFVGVQGTSYGGYSTLMAMTKFSTSFDAGISSVGISNLISFLENTAPYRRHLRISEYGDPETQRAELWELSPMKWVSQVKAPLLLFQGLNDPRVPAGEAVQFFKAVKAKSPKSKLIIFPDEGHGFEKRANRAIEIGTSLNFFIENFKNHQAKTESTPSTR